MLMLRIPQLLSRTRNAAFSGREMSRHGIYSIPGLLRYWVFETLDIRIYFVAYKNSTIDSTARQSYVEPIRMWRIMGAHLTILLS